MRILRVLPLAIRMVALVVLGIAAATAATVLLSQWLPPWAAAGVATLCVGALMGIVVWRTFVPLRALFRALAGTVAGYRDGDFSFGITWDKYSDLIELVDAHNELGNALRDQRSGQPYRTISSCVSSPHRIEYVERESRSRRDTTRRE